MQRFKALNCRLLKLCVTRITFSVLAIKLCSASVAFGESISNSFLEKILTFLLFLTTSINISAYSFFCSIDIDLSSSIESAIRQRRYALDTTSLNFSGNWGIVRANVRETCCNIICW